MASQKYSSLRTAKAVHFGSWLRQLREKRRLPLRSVAAAAEMDQAHLSKIELGQRFLTARQTLAIAKFFKVDPVQMDARRIAEKFRRDHGTTAAATQALLILKRGSFFRARRAKTRKRTSRQ